MFMLLLLTIKNFKNSIKHFGIVIKIGNFNNLYNNKLEYIEQGIRVIELNIHPHNKFNFPLDIIFKLIHATKDIPFIKFNPGMRQENIYKLYSEKKSITGKKIPYLSKGIIFKLLKLIHVFRSNKKGYKIGSNYL